MAEDFAHILEVLPRFDEFREQEPLLASRVEESLKILLKAIKDFQKNLCISFNGGKDASVVLHLASIACSLSSLSSSSSTQPKISTTDLFVIYYREQQRFEGVDEFVFDESKRMNLKLRVLESKNMKEGIELFVKEYPVEAIVMGTRATDPHSKHLESFSPTDSGWPEFVRVLPILEWEYSDIWTYLRFFGVPYCSLYDTGYTSIGNQCNTKKNPKLKTGDGKYLPAYHLIDGEKERMGRG